LFGKITEEHVHPAVPTAEIHEEAFPGGEPIPLKERFHAEAQTLKIG
jgi:hypothetical protein